MSDRERIEYDGNEAVYFHELRCFIHRIEYAPVERCGLIRLLTGNCCDMSGSIRFFQNIDPNVEMIISMYPNGQRDTSYHKIDGKWVAKRSAQPRPIREYPEHVLN